MGATGRSENYRSSLAGVLGGVQGVVWIGVTFAIPCYESTFLVALSTWNRIDSNIGTKVRSIPCLITNRKPFQPAAGIPKILPSNCLAILLD